MQEIINKKNARVLELRLYLQNTDYKIIRTAENYEVEESILTTREDARVEIRALEIEIEELERELKEETEPLIED